MRVIITGASKGIGRGIATVLARSGHQVGLLARSADLLEQLSDEIAGGDWEEHRRPVCCSAAVDLRSAAATTAGVEGLIEQLGGIDALINNAGLVIRKDVFEISLDEWHALLETNVSGLFYATRAVLPTMREQQSGHIINVSSIAGRVPLAGGSAYAASKYAVTGFSQSLFQEVRDLGIKVTTLYPGSVDSESHRHGGDDGSWKVTPEEVGEACRAVLETSPNNCICELEIRPRLRPPKR